MQILGPEAPGLKIEMVAHYRHLPGPHISAALTRLALYDPEKEVREDALHALVERPAAESNKTLQDALRYTWAPVAQRAADAIVFLHRDELIPELINALDAPDPAEPFETEVAGKQMTAVRELVKINHHRNCLLCHAPLDRPTSGGRALRGTEPVGPVPSPAEELPLSLSVAYYEARDGSTLARADVTYLRQDFSIMMEVENAKPWPKMQRFDFLIRTRVLTGEEITQLEKARMDRGPDYVSPHRQAVLSALRRLTGLDAGVNAPGWRQAVADRAK
jgi:hypothetical protein